MDRRGGGTLALSAHPVVGMALPPNGPLVFICQWPTLGTGETRVSIDAQLILDAARQSMRLWPPDKEQ
jgi:hypothetical protein